VWRIFAASILLQLCQAGEKGRKSLNKGGKDVSQSYFATNISFFGASRGHKSGWMGSKITIQICQYFFKIFERLLRLLAIFRNIFWKLIKNSYNANKNLKILHLEAKFSNFRMALVPFKNLLRFLQKKCGKHLEIGKKDLSWVAKFVSHNGTLKVILSLKTQLFCPIQVRDETKPLCNMLSETVEKVFPSLIFGSFISFYFKFNCYCHKSIFSKKIHV